MKHKPQQLTYTLAPLSARHQNQISPTIAHSKQYKYNKHEQFSSITSTTHTRAGISPPQKSARVFYPTEPANEAMGQHSDLNTSGANTTICEYVKMLTNDDYVKVDESLKSLHSSMSEGRKSEVRMTCPQEARMNRREGVDQLLDLQHFREQCIKFIQQPRVSSKQVTTGPADDDSATLIEFTDFIDSTEDNYVEKENVLGSKKEKPQIGKIAIPPMNKFDSKGCFQQSISKIAGGSLVNQKNNMPPSKSANVTARRLQETVNQSKEPEAATLSCRATTTSRTNERETCQTQPATHPSSLAKPAIQFTSSHIGSKISKKPTNAEYNSVLSHRNSYSSRLSAIQNQSRQPQKKFNPSRNVQAIATPRGLAALQNEENQRPLAPIKEEFGKSYDNRANIKGDVKAKKDQKAMKGTKIDLLDKDLSKRYQLNNKERKVEEYVESLDVLYGMLSKAIANKKVAVSHNDQCMRKLEGLRDNMIDALSALNNLKSE